MARGNGTNPSRWVANLRLNLVLKDMDSGTMVRSVFASIEMLLAQSGTA